MYFAFKSSNLYTKDATFIIDYPGTRDTYKGLSNIIVEDT
jgi:hypothetical protein